MLIPGFSVDNKVIIYSPSSKCNVYLLIFSVSKCVIYNMHLE